MIELHNVSFCYAGSEDAGGIKDINLTIPGGQVLLLCGQSGCGKTTITRLINGLIPNYYEGDLSGSVIIDKNEVNKLPLYETAKYVGSVFQNPRSQFFTVDSTSELAFGSENQGIDKSKIITKIFDVAKEYKMKTLLGKNIFKLSGGEKQKIACTSISVAEPNIVVLDEPSSNLDITATRDLRNLISMWKSQGKTIIIAEHRLYYLAGLVDRVVYLRDGKISSDFGENQLSELNGNCLTTMGLRPFHLSDYPVKRKEVINRGTFFISDFYFSYQNKQAALNIPKLELPNQSIIALIGHNGAGKSTLARCLCGLEKHCRGIVIMKEKRYNNKQRLKQCYMVMQDVNHQLFTESIEEEILLSMEISDKEKVNEIMDRLDLKSLSQRHPMSLSGGEKQRVAIASALVSEREIVVFDEPTSGLDLKHMEEVSKELILLQQLGKIVIVITHDYELIASCCTHVLHLEQGTVKKVYSLDDLGIKQLNNFFFEKR